MFSLAESWFFDYHQKLYLYNTQVKIVVLSNNSTQNVVVVDQTTLNDVGSLIMPPNM